MDDTTCAEGFLLTHNAVPAALWEDIRTWLGVDLDDPARFVDFVRDDTHQPTNNVRDNCSAKTVPWEMSTVVQNRPVAQFGFRYDYLRDVVDTESCTPPIPPLLQRLIDLAWADDALASLLSPSTTQDDTGTNISFTQCIINVYGPTSHIPWHKDDPAFGPVILVYTFGETRPLQLRQQQDKRETQTVHPRHLSRYVLSGPSRHDWEHAVPVGNDWRISITFRSSSA